MTEATWNRDELYEKVWTKPVTKVAEEFGVSDVAIAKVCRKLQVPLPGRGYWAKRQHGHQMPRKALPKLNESIVVTRNVPPVKATDNTQTPLHPEDQAEFDRIGERKTQGAFVFSSASKALRHPLIVATRDALRNGSADDRKILRPKLHSGAINVRVGKDTVKRALDMLASIIGCAEAQGAKIAVHQNDRERQTVFIAFGQNVSFAIFETAHQRVLEHAPVQRYGGYSAGPTFAGRPVEYLPTGKMTLEIHAYRGGLRRIWKEGKLNLDSLLPDIMVTFFKAAVLERRAHLNRLAEAERCQRRELELRELRLKVQEEERRVHNLEQAAENWTKAKKIREYVLAVIDVKKEPNEELGPDTPLGTWAVWALQQADRLDPLVKSPPSVLDRKKEFESDRTGNWSSLWRG